MKVDENGFIIDISVEEAVQLLTPIFINTCIARKNGKPVANHNLAVAWLKICDTVHQINSQKGREK